MNMGFILSKATFGILAATFILIGGIPYINDIFKRRVKPHILSWLGWSFITAIGAFAMFAEGSTWTVALIFANTVMCLIIAFSAMTTKTGIWSTGVQDYIFFGAGLLGIALWQILDMPILALVFAILADLAFGIPTIIKTYKDPTTETPFPWAMSVVAGIFGILAIQHFVFYDAAYPVYLFIFDIIVFLLILKIFKRKTIHIEESELNSPR